MQDNRIRSRPSNNRLAKRTWVLVVTLACLGGVLTIILASDHTDVASTDSPIAKADARQGDHKDESRPLSVSKRTPAPEPPTTELRVEEASGRPIANAAVWKTEEGRHEYTPEGSGFVGKTDVDGVLDLPPSAERSPLVVGHPAFVTGEAMATPMKTTTVVLEEACSVSFRCVTHDLREPLAGAVVGLTLGSVHPVEARFGEKRAPEPDFTEAAARSFIALPPRAYQDIVYRAADSSGVVTFRGLPVFDDSKYFAWGPGGFAFARGPGYFPMDSRPIQPNQQSIELGFVELRAVAYRTQGDTLESSRGRIRTQSSKGRRRTFSDGLALRQASEVTKSLEAMFAPGTRVSVIPRGELIRLSLIFENSGERFADLPFRSVAQVRESGPVILVADELPRSRRPLEMIELELLNGNGIPIRNIDLILTSGTESYWIPIRPGDRRRIPHGTYRIGKVDDWSIVSELRDSPDIVIDGQTPKGPDGVIRIQRKLSSTLRLTEIRPPDDVTFLWVKMKGNTGRQLRIEPDSGPIRIYMHPGNYVVTTPDGKSREVYITFSEPGNADPQVVDLSDL